MTTWVCATCGPVPAGEIRHLDHDSPHGHETHECGSSAGLDWTKKEHEMTTTPTTETDDRPTWTWTNDLRNPQSIHVEPSFKTELGLVFIGIGERDEDGTWKSTDSHRGIWLDREQCLRLNRAVKEAATWSEMHDEDDES